MNAPTHFEGTSQTDQGKKHFRHPNPDTVPEEASFNEPMQPPNTVRPYVLSHGTCETFIDGAGI